MFKKRWMVECRYSDGFVALLPSRRFRTEERARMIADLAELNVFQRTGEIVQMTPVLIKDKN